MSWLEFSRVLPGIVMALLVLAVVALLVADGLRSLVSNLRWRRARKSRSPEVEAIDAIDRYQGSFRVDESGAVRQRFAHRYEIGFRNEWGNVGKWKPWS